MNDPKTTQQYLDLITSEHQGQPDFAGTITAVVDVLVQVQTLLVSMIEIFDIDLNPVGNQLDIIGQWVGAPRTINSAFAGVFFTWDDLPSDGWDFGVWQQAGSPSAVVTLPDDVYLSFIKAKIGINQWDGTTLGIYAIWAEAFPQFNIMIQDNQNMSYIVIIQGTVPNSLFKALIVGGFIVPKPEGIRIADYVFPVDTNPIFAWDSDSAGLKGWDEGSWGVFVAPT